MKRWLIALLVLLAQGVWADPAVVPPPVYRGADPAVQGRSIGDLHWFELFGDPQLQALIRTAMVHNADLRTAVATVTLERTDLGLTQANHQPLVTVGGDVNKTQISANGASDFPGANIPRTRTFMEVVANLVSFEIDVWGRLRRQTEAAQAELRASEADQRAVMTTVVGDVASGYFNLLELDAELDIARRTLSTRIDSLRLIKLREAHGLASMLDVRQGEQLVETAEETVPQTESRIAQTENLINLLEGNLPGSVERGHSLTDQAEPPAVPPGLPSELLLRRPDIQSAEARLASQHAQVASVRASYFPRISLTGLLGFQSTALSSLIEGDSKEWGVNPAVTGSLFDGGRAHYGLQQARANQELALIAYQRTLLTAFSEVSDALVQVSATRTLARQQADLVGTLQERSRLAYLRYQGGVDSLLNALDADRDLFNAQLGLAQARRNQLLALVQLYKALGGGWQL